MVCFPQVFPLKFCMHLKRQGAWLRTGRPWFDSECGRGGDFSSLLHVQTGPEVHSASYKMSTGGFPRGSRRPSIGLATLPLPSAVAVNMWTLASTSPVGPHGLYWRYLYLYLLVIADVNEVKKDNYKRRILSRIDTCPG